MKFKNTILNTTLALAILSGSAIGQEAAAEAKDTSSSKLDNVFIGASLGSAFSYADIKQYPSGTPVFTNRSEYGYGFNGFVGYQFNSYFALEGDLSWVRLNGTRRVDGVWYTASVVQYDLVGRLNLTNLISKKSIETRKFDVYLLGGVGMSTFRSRRHTLVAGTSGDLVNSVEGYEAITGIGLMDDLVKKRRTRSGSGMLGLGLSYRATSKLDVFLDFRGYYLNSDKLDATISPNATNDKYTYNSLGVTYHLGKSGGKSRKMDENSTEAQMNDLLDKFKDTDGDGVADVNDKEINTVKGAKVGSDGVALDTDGDGIADHLDAEKLSPCKDVDAQGVAKDSDADGVIDCKDKEPNTAKGAQVDANGKTISTGTAPAATSTPTSSNSKTPSASAGVVSGLPSVFFDLNSSTISYKNYPALTQVAQYLKANPSAKLVLVGNSDKVGSAEYNKKLSEKRAKAIVEHLVKNNGVDKTRLTVVAKGSEEPISTKRNSEQNRRVDFMLSK